MSTARIAGIIAAIVFGVLFLVTLFATLGPAKIVAPTDGVTAGGRSDDPGGLAALPTLQDRTAMQRWPGKTTHPAAATQALPPGPTTITPSAGDKLVQQWQSDKGVNRDILKHPQLLRGVSSLPGADRGVLMQPQGRTWRHVRNDKLAYGGAIYIFGVSLLLAVFLAWRGRVRIVEGESGSTIERFAPFERANHWLTAVSFLLMAFTGLDILYGNGVIRPWLGASAYATLARASAWSHMTFAVPFVIGVVVMIWLWVHQNLFERLDWEWLKQGGGLLRDDGTHPPARKFNAGQKLVFWGVVLGGGVLTLTGAALMFPFFWGGYTTMQAAQSLHATIGLLMIGLIIGHIYIGTIGMEGAFAAMWSGWVDRNWAKEHHSLWYRAADGATKPVAAAETHRTVRGVGSFATGAAAAVVAALVMGGIYGFATMSSASRTALTNPSVHLDRSEGTLRLSQPAR